MKRAVTATIAVVFFYFIYGLVVSQYTLTVIPSELEPAHPRGFYDYKGVTNVHTTLSTGSGTYTEVIKAAQDSGLDFIFFTDTNAFEKPKGVEGYHNKVLAFVDGEYSYIDSRLLNYGANSKRHLRGPGRSQALFADLLTQGIRHDDAGVFVLAHPFKPGYRWAGEYPIGLDGVEIINLKSIWENAWLHSKASFLWTILIYPFNPELAFIRLFTPPERELALWDELSRHRPRIGVAGSDAEARIKAFDSYLTVPSYQTLFNIVRNHILLRSELTGNAVSDKEKVIQALKKGQFYMSLDIMANPKGFLAVIEDGQSKTYPMGSKISWKEGLSLKVTLPHKPLVPFETIVFKDGQRMMISNSEQTTFQLHEPGIYRVVVRVIPTFPLPDGKKWIPWIYTNPFYISPG